MRSLLPRIHRCSAQAKQKWKIMLYSSFNIPPKIKLYLGLEMLLFK